MGFPRDRISHYVVRIKVFGRNKEKKIKKRRKRKKEWNHGKTVINFGSVLIVS